jgi:hypothetical protein
MSEVAKNLGGYLERFGEKLIENGYNIVPIEAGMKGPVDDDWQKTVATKKLLDKWLESGRGSHGIGILTKNLPAVDLDVPDEDFALELQAKAIELWGPSPVRIGNAPKRLLLYRTSTPFPKISSRTFIDEWGDRCKVEILCDGQQFVAYHIHKDTRRPYVWTTAEQPTTVEAADLPRFNEDKVQELIDLFEDGARARGWKESTGSILRRQATGQVDRNDPFAADAHPIDMAQPELHRRLMMVPGNDDYDVWFQIGMCLYHQYDGDDVGREMWHEWSESANNYDREALDRKWKTFDIEDKQRAPVTARLILKLAKEAAESKALATAADLRDRFAQAKDRAEWNEAAKEARSAEIDHLTRAGLAEVARDRLQILTGGKVPLTEVKKTLAYEINTKDTPRWCRDWVYDATEDRFYHTIAKYAVTVQGFNAINDRHAMTKKDILEGKGAATSSASSLALNVYKIPTVNGRMYAPGRDPIFIYNHTTMVNTYPENQVPPRPKTIRPMDIANIKRIKKHLKHLLADPRERRMLLDWMAYVVQNPGKRVNYAPLIQGVQGDGKSFFAFLLAACMGLPNVRMGNAHILEGQFTGWAQGQCVMAIEEIRLIGHNRYDVLNRVKPFITNPVIEVHPKGRDPYNVENTTNYLLFTNYQDAMPLSINERRFLVLFSQWQDRVKLAEFKAENPDYYVDLYAALDDSAPAIREWLLQHEMSEEFNPKGDAPATGAFLQMVNSAMPSDARGIMEVINSGEYPDISEDLLNITLLQGLEMTLDIEIPKTTNLEKTLGILGFFSLGRVKINGVKQRFYSKNPEKFLFSGPHGTEIDTQKIRSYLKKNNLESDEEEDF